VAIDATGPTARYVRVTATRLAPRQNDYNFALAEVEVFDPNGSNVARGARVSAMDSIEALPRWRQANLVDGDYPSVDSEGLPELKDRRAAMIREALDDASLRTFDEATRSIAEVERQVGSLPPGAGLRRDGPQRHRGLPGDRAGRRQASGDPGPSPRGTPRPEASRRPGDGSHQQGSPLAIRPPARCPRKANAGRHWPDG